MFYSPWALSDRRDNLCFLNHPFKRVLCCRCDSSTFITDAADVCADLPEINLSLSCLEDEKRKLEKQDSGFHTMSFKNSNFMTAEEENPRSDRLDLEACRLPDQSPSSPESDAYISPGTRAAPEGGAKYTSLRRQSSTDGDVYEKQSLLVTEPDEEASKGPPIDSATILVNKPGIREQQELKEDTEKYEMHDMSVEGACASPLPVNSARAHSSNPPPSGGTGKQIRAATCHRTLGDFLTLPKRASGSGTPQVSSPLASQRRTLPEAERKRKIQVLQRELARIQKELKSLGEVEIEISYV